MPLPPLDLSQYKLPAQRALNLRPSIPNVDPNTARAALADSTNTWMQKFKINGNSFTPKLDNSDQLISGTGLPGATSGSTPMSTDTGSLDMAKNIGGAIVGSEVGLGNDVAAAIGGNTMAKTFSALPEADQNYLSTIIDMRKKAAVKGDQTEFDHFTGLLKSYKTSQGDSITDVFPALKKSNEQVIGDVAGTALDVLTAGAGETLDSVLKSGEAGYQTGKLGVKAGGIAERLAQKTGVDALTNQLPKDTSKGLSLWQRMAKGAGFGGSFGAGAGFAGGLQGNENAKDVALSTAIGAGTGAVFGGATEGIIGKRAALTGDDAIADSKKILNPSNKFTPTEDEQLRNTGQVKTKGKSIFAKEVPDITTTHQHETLAELVEQGKISSKNLPNENQTVLKQEARVNNANIREIVNRPDLNIPFRRTDVFSKFDNLGNSAPNKYLFTKGGTEEAAYNTVVDAMKRSINEQPANSAGLRTAIENFNRTMQEANPKVYDEASANIRTQAAKDARTLANNILADHLDEAKVNRITSKLRPSDAENLIKKAENFPNREDYITYAKQNISDYPESGFTPGSARKRLSTTRAEDLGELWDIAHTEVKSTTGDLYRSQLRREAELLNASDEISYKTRGSTGKSRTKLFFNAHPILKKAAVATGVAGAGYLGGEGIKEVFTGQ